MIERAPAAGETPATPSEQVEESASDFAALRELIVGPEQEQLSALRARVENRDRRTRDVSEVLPDAAAMCGDDAALSRALGPAVEDALIASVRANPNTLADVLFPVMGPAIRKSLAQFLATMLEGMNRTLEQSFSVQGLLWRWQALRTGKSFAEIVLLHTLVYRTEQIFLIHRQTGLPLLHVAAPEVRDDIQDADMVSGMLTAIRDFVQDAFRQKQSGESLDAMRVGELEVWVEQGPQAILAGVVRGAAPKELRTIFQETLERIHGQFAHAFEGFSGDTAPFAAARPQLEACLRSGYRTPVRRRVSPALVAVLVALLLIVGWVALSSWQEARRWNAYLTRLRAEPGLLVISESSSWGGHEVVGLRDPLARNPDELLNESGLDAGRVSRRWETYLATEPALYSREPETFCDRRPESRFSFKDGVLSARGASDPAWVTQASALARLIPGVRDFAYDSAFDDLFKKVAPAIEGCHFYFSLEAVTPTSDPRCEWATLVRHVRELAAAARAAGRVLRVSIVGFADSSGQPGANVALSQARADAVRDRLVREGISGLEVEAVGKGVRNPEAGRSLADDRHVAFSVSVSEPSASPASVRR